MLADASVARNFAVLGWTDELIALAGGSLSIAHGVLGMDCDEVGEIERIRAAFDNESMRSPGSPMASAATAALVGLDDLIRRRSKDITVLAPTEVEMAVAIRLQDPREGTWRRSLGVRARRLDAGEAVAIATARGLTFASDDDDGALPTRRLLASDTVGHWISSRRRSLKGCSPTPTREEVTACSANDTASGANPGRSTTDPAFASQTALSSLGAAAPLWQMP